jgi:cytoskeletal protein CcmA (bactofilin family)
MVEANSGSEFTTVIGPDAVIKGEVAVERGIRVDGQIEGSVETKGSVVIGKSGQAKAEIRAGTLSIEGKLTGNALAEKVQVEASGQVFGDLTATRLVVSEGATFVGKVNVNPEAVKDQAKAGTAVASTTRSSATTSAFPGPVGHLLRH